VGILAFTFYNYLVSKINKLVLDMEVISNDVVDIIEEVSVDGNEITEQEELEI
jgi:biopolymer transport protein ExbB/TolQ